MEEAYIVSACRTPIGSFMGSLSSIPAPRLGAMAIQEALKRAAIPPEKVDQVYMGCVLPAGLGQAPARQASIYAGLPYHVGAVTVNKVCGSGLKAVMIGGNDIRVGEGEVIVAGGMENMSQAPYLLQKARGGYRMGHGELLDVMIHDGLWDPYKDMHMGNCGEICANHFGFSRKEQDAFSQESYRRAQEATEKGWFQDEIIPVEIPQRKGEPLLVGRDEEPFRIPMEKIPKLKPAFQKDGTITAGNASKINDGAAALVLTGEKTLKELNLSPMARILAQASHAQEPEWFTTAPAKAIQKVLDKSGRSLEEIDLFEVNEAFAVVAMATMKELGIPHEKLNVHGGAVSLGHPIGCSGARILTTLLYALKRYNRRYGIAAICIGGGEAVAVLVERL